MTKFDDLPSDKQRFFVLEYIIDFNATRAAIAAGYSEATATQQGYKLINDERVAAAIDEAIAERRKRLRIDADNVLHKWWQISTADYNELMQVRRVNCRYCWGREHEYQWTAKEYERACQEAEAEQLHEPSNIGGLDFNHNKAANQDCPECGGAGVEKIIINDSTQLSHAANLVYQGVKQTKTGLEVMTVDRMKALDNVARHLGMFKDTVNHISDDGSMSSKPTVIRLVAPKVDENGKIVKD